MTRNHGLQRVNIAHKRRFLLYLCIGSLWIAAATSIRANAKTSDTNQPFAVIYHTGDVGGNLSATDESIGADYLASIVE
ncbi:MAG: hypothetical protein LBM60_07695, partial [Clostridium sp.]|nr:hypothetical protein [Clostridium sp.]